MWSPDPEKASRFYTSVFDWKINYTPDLSYWLVDAGAFSGAGGINGGMFRPQPGQLPAKLALYVQVDDVAAYAKKAEAAGAKVLVPETEIPGVGWSAILLDPEDRAFGLFKPLQR
jgi:predicted enzyme related to lactoylglutathione lyase